MQALALPLVTLGAVGEGSSAEQLYYVTVLSNFVRGYDKYSGRYDKARIPESTFAGRFFLLRRSELGIGVTKATPLLAKANVAGDRLIALETHAQAAELRPNLRTGLGRSVECSFIEVDAVHFVNDGELQQTTTEDLSARSFALLESRLTPWEALVPRSVSVLPIARACQASCPFCFSKASVSADLKAEPLDWSRTSEVLRAAKARGASRAVITGGGEPTLLDPDDFLRLVGEAGALFSKVVLITNGARLAVLDEAERLDRMRALRDAGLSVLALSRHHFDADRNAELMQLRTGSERLARSLAMMDGVRLRWVCVLQRGGVEDRASLEQYLDWAAETGADEVCFKELYVSTSIESEFHDRRANEWSRQHQVPLRLILDFARDAGWTLKEQLPWGAPVFEGVRRGRPLRIAAYTEPSLLWERTHGLSRSWNLMADGRCLASLEDRSSEVCADGLRRVSPLS